MHSPTILLFFFHGNFSLYSTIIEYQEWVINSYPTWKPKCCEDHSPSWLLLTAVQKLEEDQFDTFQLTNVSWVCFHEDEDGPIIGVGRPKKVSWQSLDRSDDGHKWKFSRTKINHLVWFPFLGLSVSVREQEKKFWSRKKDGCQDVIGWWSFIGKVNRCWLEG